MIKELIPPNHLNYDVNRVTVRLAAIEHDSVVNGEGVRTVLYTQGCSHHCKGCHNPRTWDFEGGRQFSYNEILKEVKQNKLSNGVTWSGGDPVYQENNVFLISKELKLLGYNIWLYTGFTYEYLLKFKPLLLSVVDVLVDGMFELDKKTLELPFVGSSNQRVIDVPTSFKEKRVKVLYRV